MSRSRSDYITALPALLHNGLVPLPPEPERQQLLPNMTAKAVCHRMLANLCNLCRSAAPPHWASGGEVGCLQLSTALVQLGARFAADAFRHAFPAVSRGSLSCWSWLAGLYLQLLQGEKLRGVLLPVSDVWQLCTGLMPGWVVPACHAVTCVCGGAL